MSVTDLLMDFSRFLGFILMLAAALMALSTAGAVVICVAISGAALC